MTFSLKTTIPFFCQSIRRSRALVNKDIKFTKHTFEVTLNEGVAHNQELALGGLGYIQLHNSLNFQHKFVIDLYGHQGLNVQMRDRMFFLPKVDNIERIQIRKVYRTG
jgi:hypothetical protein